MRHATVGIYVRSLEGCYNPIGRGEAKSWNVWLNHMKWSFWEKLVERWGDVCEIPIGRDDTGGAGVWDLYRDWLYRGKIAENWSEKRRKNMTKITYFSWMDPPEDRFGWTSTRLDQKISRWRIWSQKKTFTGQMASYEESRFFIFFYFRGVADTK